MKVRITKRWTERREEEVEFDLLAFPKYFFEFGYRVAWAIIPEWTTWQLEQGIGPEVIYKYNVITVDGTDKLEKFEISVSRIPEIYDQNREKSTLRERAVRFIVDGVETRSVRTKKQFSAELSRMLNEVYVDGGFEVETNLDAIIEKAQEEDKEMKVVIYCPDCNSTDLQVPRWVKVNNQDEALGLFGEHDPEVYCSCCDEFVGAIRDLPTKLINE